MVVGERTTCLVTLSKAKGSLLTDECYGEWLTKFRQSLFLGMDKPLGLLYVKVKAIKKMSDSLTC